MLPEAFTADPDRLARFEREAKVLASLNHPNIAAIYGLEEADGTRALVLELVEGPTLADRIKRGPIPLDEALPIAKQIAEALEAAHEAGVIHRDPETGQHLGSLCDRRHPGQDDQRSHRERDTPQPLPTPTAIHLSVHRSSPCYHRGSRPGIPSSPGS